jgi:hypothetical protein
VSTLHSRGSKYVVCLPCFTSTSYFNKRVAFQGDKREKEWLETNGFGQDGLKTRNEFVADVVAEMAAGNFLRGKSQADIEK